MYNFLFRCYTAAMQTPEEAWAAAKSGQNMSRLARQLKISRTALYSWKRVPEHRLRMVSMLTSIPRERLRPDLYYEPWAAL